MGHSGAMHLDRAREYKAELRAFATVRAEAEPPEPALPLRRRVAVGVCVLGAGVYGLAVRYGTSSPFEQSVVDRAREIAGEECDVRQVGAIRAQQWSADELQQRQRPLRPGLSIAHVDVTAGTLGAFVTSADDRVRVLSNNHVLADSDRGAVGDVVLQPGSADGGSADGGADGDRIGVLDAVVALDPDGTNLVDAATAVLDDGIEVEAAHPAGSLVGTIAPDDDLPVEKVGRTTGLTRGRISAIELDGVSVEYPVGVVEFDDQIEVTGDAGEFSAGGDSGSMVYRPDTLEGVGLLFAGSETGGPGGAGLTYCNPLTAVLDELGVRLVSSP